MSSSSSSNNTDEMIEQQMSTSTSSIQKRFKYDVFISFRGEDTRKNFVDHLYYALKDKGIYTYKDDENIQKGERISDELIKAIEDSKFYIIVFTKNYASSSWCLEELVKIMECHKMPGHTAYPIFYDVEPTELRNQSGSIRKAFFKNKEKEAAEKWKGALKEAANLAGWELKNTLDGGEAEFIQMIVDKMSLELHFGFDANSVGMVTRVKDVVTPATVLNKLVEARVSLTAFVDQLWATVLNKLVEAIGSLTAFLGQLWANYYPRVVEVDLTPGSAFSFIIWCLLVFAGLKSQSVTGFPFKTHPNAIKVPFTSLLIYAFASMAELVVSVARLDHTSVYAIIARLGRISSLCVFVTSLAILIYI